MAVTGRKPKEEGEKRNRVLPRHDWTEVDNVPFAGKPPVSLPSKRSLILKDGTLVDIPLHRQTRAWWQRIRRMPHCRLWSESDWQFALETALIADALFYGSTAAAAELRQREKILGTTEDARRDLRIRYVDPEPEPEEDAGASSVTRLADRRRRLLDDAS